MLRVAVEIRASISVPSMGAFRTGVFTSFCRALVLHREGQVGVTLGSLSSIAAAYNWTWGLECLLFTTMYLTCQDLAHSRCLIFPESVNTWVELLWVFYLETSIPKEEEKEEKGRGRWEEGRKKKKKRQKKFVILLVKLFANFPVIVVPVIVFYDSC